MPIKKSSLLVSGGQGCVFEPAIQCYQGSKKGEGKASKKSKNKKSKKSKNKKGKRTVSKVMFQRKSAEREITMDDLVRQIEGHEEWSVLWSHMCDTPAYKTLTKTSDIDKCLGKKTDIPKKAQTRYPMLVGPFGGKTLYEFSERLLTKRVFQTQSAFDAALLKIFGTLEPIFVGLIALQKAKISHADLSVRNVLVKDGSSVFIDFGLAYRFSNQRYVKGHVKFLMTGTDRIYDAYPYEYYLYHGHKDKKKLQEELDDMDKGIFREYHDGHVRFHELIMGRRNTDETLRSYMQTMLGGKKPNLTEIIKGLDTYSVGILMPTLLHDICESRKVPFAVLEKRCLQTKHPQILGLCKIMTAFYAKDRPSPQEAYDSYQEIV